MNPRLAAITALIAGALLTTSLAPISIWPAALVSLALLLIIIRGCTPKQAFLRGWLYGIGLFGSGASWVYVSINQFGNADVPLATFLTVIWCVGLGLLSGFTCYLLRRINTESAAIDLILFPALWVIGEWLRTWLLTGFPWLFVGYGQIDGPLQAHGPIWGVLGIGFVVALTAALIANWGKVEAKLMWIASATVAALWSVTLWLPADHWTIDSEDRLTVGLVQANIDQNEKWLPSKVPQHIALQRQMSESLWGLDLVLWPEAAIPALYHRAEPLIDLLQQRAIESGSTFVSGIPYKNVADGAVYNSIVGLDNQTQLYFKRKLVPFGEFIPLEDILRGAIDFFNLPMSDFTEGAAQQSYLNVNGRKAAALICYEAVYLDMVKQPGGLPQFLLTISNDTWFGESLGPLQHLQMARMRALEWGRAMVRGTNNGVSALIAPNGEIIAQTEQFKQTVLRGQIPILVGETPYARFGTMPVLVLCALLILMALFHTLRYPSRLDK